MLIVVCRRRVKTFCLKCPPLLEIDKSMLKNMNFQRLSVGDFLCPFDILNVDRFDLLSENTCTVTVFAVFSACSHCRRIQLKLSQGTLSVSFLIILHINRYYVGENQTMTLPLIHQWVGLVNYRQILKL